MSASGTERRRYGSTVNPWKGKKTTESGLILGWTAIPFPLSLTAAEEAFLISH